jgi:pimeloyl-ACP methyl ester carboxylesterase
MLQLLRQEELSDVTVVGLGFGGFIAAEMATMDSGVIGRLVLVGAAGIKPPEGEILDQMLIDHAEYMRQGFRDAKTFDKFFGDLDDTDVRSLWEFNRVMTARVCWKPYMFDRRLPHFLGGVKIPALQVWGEKDRVVPLSVGREYARLLPNAKLEIIKGAGHLVDFEEPDKLAALIQSHAG